MKSACRRSKVPREWKRYIQLLKGIIRHCHPRSLAMVGRLHTEERLLLASMVGERQWTRFQRQRETGELRNPHFIRICTKAQRRTDDNDLLEHGLTVGSLPVNWRPEDWKPNAHKWLRDGIVVDMVAVGTELQTAHLRKTLEALVPLMHAETTILLMRAREDNQKALCDGLLGLGWTGGQVGPVAVLRRAS